MREFGDVCPRFVRRSQCHSTAHVAAAEVDADFLKERQVGSDALDVARIAAVQYLSSRGKLRRLQTSATTGPNSIGSFVATYEVEL
jgi:hypothetical protein